MRTLITPAVVLALSGAALAQHDYTRPAAQTETPTDWREAEAPVLTNHLQLTFADRFHKAGESYFSPDDQRIVFQAVEKPQGEAPAEEFYGMYVADVVRDASGRITGINRIRRVSPPGSANTCGWFHPTDPNVLLFGSTIEPPTESRPPGYQRASGRYRWMFPPEMTIVTCDLREANGTAATLTPVIESDDAYLAECSWSGDGRHLLYCSLESNLGDILVRDTKGSAAPVGIVTAPGYDGGPFFSPDDRRVCYRSDRQGNHLLQLYVAELEYDDDGAIVGVDREYQLTNNDNVNWCPFWHPDGRHLVYGTSEVGHYNYEVFIIDADPGDIPGAEGPIRYGSGKRRITFAPGADVLPAFNADGSVMMWTSKRGASESSQLWLADFVLPGAETAGTAGR